MRDTELVELLRGGDPHGLDELLLHHGPLMRYIIAPILSDPREREECLSDVAMRVWEQIDRFDPKLGKLTTWLSILTRNTALNRARRGKREGIVQELDPSLPDPGRGPEDSVLQGERTQLLRDTLRELSPQESALFYRKYYYLQSTAQIAAEMGMTERAVEGRLYRIKRHLRQKLGGDRHE